MTLTPVRDYAAASATSKHAWRSNKPTQRPEKPSSCRPTCAAISTCRTVTTSTCATAHAVKDNVPYCTNVLMGRLVQAEFNDRAAAIGFTALSGTIGRPGKPPTRRDVALPDSLEGRVFAHAGDDIHYLGRRQLAKLGMVSTRPLNYRQSTPAKRATLLDGLVVLREEQPQYQGDTA